MTIHMPASAELLVKEINTLVALPDICLRLRNVLADPEHSRREVAEILQYDVALCARLLRIVNCAYFGLPARVGNISQALGILGELELRNLVFVTAIVDRLSVDADGFDLTTFWKASVLGAVVARTCAQGFSRELRDEYFLSGLLLNVGKLALYRKEPELHAAVVALQRSEGCPDHAAERALLGYDHAAVGAILAAAWNFPAALVEGIAGHHEPAPTSHRQAALGLASLAGDCLVSGTAPDLPALAASDEGGSMLARLNLDETAAGDMLAIARGEYEQVFEVFCGGAGQRGTKR